MTATKRRMSKAQMRVAIAKDVLALLRKKKLAPAHGNFVCRPKHILRPRPELFSSMDERDLGVILMALPEPCEACAVGAMTVAAAVRFDRCPAVEFNSSALEWQDCVTVLERYFDNDSIRNIEAAFEVGIGWCGPAGTTHGGSKHIAAEKFARRFKTAAGRMKVIMRNIIKNKGTFKP